MERTRMSPCFVSRSDVCVTSIVQSIPRSPITRPLLAQGCYYCWSWSWNWVSSCCGLSWSWIGRGPRSPDETQSRSLARQEVRPRGVQRNFSTQQDGSMRAAWAGPTLGRRGPPRDRTPPRRPRQPSTANIHQPHSAQGNPRALGRTTSISPL